MRLSVILLACALLGVIGGAYLAGGLPAVGGAVIFDSLAVGGWALLHDDGQGEPKAVPLGMPRALHEAIERARAS